MSEQPTMPFAKAKQLSNNRLGEMVDTAYWGEMPDYAVDPFQWEQRLRGRFATSMILAKAGLKKKDLNTDVLIKEVLKSLQDDDQMGNERVAWQRWHKRVHKYMEMKAKHAAEKPENLLRKEGAELGLTPDCIAQIMRTPSGKGGFAKNMEFYRLKMREAAGKGFYETGFEPDITSATQTMLAYEAAQRERDAAKKAAEQPEDLNAWFPRDEEGKPVTPEDEKAIDDLKASLTPLADDDELTTPVWSAVTAKDIEGQRIAAFKHFSREMSSRDDPANVSEHLLNALHGIPLGTCIEQNGIQTTVDYLQMYINNPQEIVKSKSGLEDTQNEPTAIGVHEMQSEAPAAQKPSEKQATVSQLPEAPFSANFKLTHKTGVEIQFTIRAASGAEGIPQIDSAITYLLEHGYATRQQAAQSLPPNATPIGDAPSAQQNSAGKSVCMMIKVARSYTGNKPQLEFEVDGFENPIRFTSDNPGKLASALKGIRKPDGSEFTAADMTDGRKFGGNWLLSWEKKEKDNKTYTNFISIAAA